MDARSLNSPSNAVLQLEIHEDENVLEQKDSRTKTQVSLGSLVLRMFYSCSDLVNEWPSVLLTLLSLGHSTAQNLTEFV